MANNSNKKCLPMERIADAVWSQGPLSQEERQEILDHASDCEHCAPTLRIFQGLLMFGHSKRRALEGPSEEEEAQFLKSIEKAKAEYLRDPDRKRKLRCAMSGCVSDSQIIDSLKSVTGDSTRAVEQHLGECIDCEARYKLVRELDRMDLSPQSVLATQDATPRMRLFMDESGSETPGRYDDSPQPSLCIAGVITTPEKVEAIDSVRQDLLAEYGLPASTEVHADPCLRCKEEYEALSGSEEAERLLWEFIEINLPNFLFFYAPDMLKPFVREDVRLRLPTQGLSQYTAVFAHQLWITAKYLEYEVGTEFDLVYDENDAVAEDLPRIAKVLTEHPDPKVRITNLVGEPTPCASHESPGIQLADVIAFYMARHHQIEIPKYDHGENLDLHKAKIIRVHDELLAPKSLPWFTGEFCSKIDSTAFTETQF